jgi:hypothetical protein
MRLRKQSSALLQVIAVSSDDPEQDGLFLSNYATIDLLDALKRVPASATRRCSARSTTRCASCSTSTG